MTFKILPSFKTFQITLRNTGYIFIPETILQNKGIKSAKGVIIMYDLEKQLIAVQPTNDTSLEGYIKCVQERSGISFPINRLLKYFKIRRGVKISLDFKFANKMFIFDFSKYREGQR